MNTEHNVHRQLSGPSRLGLCSAFRQRSGSIYYTFTAGKVVDLGITDANNMGAAMAPAAPPHYLLFQDTALRPRLRSYCDRDLGKTGHGIATELLRDDGIIFSGNFSDCGLMVYDLEKQDVHAAVLDADAQQWCSAQK